MRTRFCAVEEFFIALEEFLFAPLPPVWSVGLSTRRVYATCAGGLLLWEGSMARPAPRQARKPKSPAPADVRPLTSKCPLHFPAGPRLGVAAWIGSLDASVRDLDSFRGWRQSGGDAPAPRARC